MDQPPFPDRGTLAAGLLSDVQTLLRREPAIGALFGLSPQIDTPAALFSAVLGSCGTSLDAQRSIEEVAKAVFEADAEALDAGLTDLATTARKNFEPGGMATALLFSRGIHALLGFRVTHSLWAGGRHDLALALKTVFGRAFSTDMHPAARLGKGIWLDHGLGFVVGETAIVSDDVSIWHGVTLGSTLKDSGGRRHPRIGRGVTIGADSVLLGGIDIGEGSVIAAGSVVLADVPAGTTVAGVPAKPKMRGAQSFKGF